MDSFCYCWTDHATNKLYVGVHKGTEDDGYVSSGKLMLESYAVRPSDFTRQIIARGTFKDMLKLERAILEAADAGKNPMFYNRRIGTGHNFHKHTAESKAKMRAAHLGVSTKGRKKPVRKPHSEETKRKIAAQRWNHSEETKAKLKLSQEKRFAGLAKYYEAKRLAKAST